MNIIEAYKKANGKKIYRAKKLIVTSNQPLTTLLSRLNEEELQCDDWEIVPDQKKKTMTVNCHNGNVFEVYSWSHAAWSLPEGVDIEATFKWEE